MDRRVLAIAGDVIMSRENDRIRRELGMDMIQEQQQYAAMHPRKSVAKIESPVDPRKLADAQCQGGGCVTLKTVDMPTRLSREEERSFIISNSGLGALAIWLGLDEAKLDELFKAPLTVDSPKVLSVSVVMDHSKWEPSGASPEEAPIDVMGVTRQMCK